MSVLLWLANLAYFMLPAYLANMAPLVSRFFNFNAPLDFNTKINGERVLGKNKTLLGSLFGIAAGTLTAFVQQFVFIKTGVGIVDYSNWLSIGLLLGCGAIFGDALKSFFKRRFRVQPGKSWIPFDQIDFTVGALFFVSFVYFPGWIESIAIVCISALGHIAVNHCAFWLGIRKEKW